MLALAAVPLTVLAGLLVVRIVGVERVRTALGNWVDRVSEPPPGPKKEPNSDCNGGYD